MKHLLILLLLAVSLGAMAAPQDTRPPLSEDEVLDLLNNSMPSKALISTVQKYGIAFQPTPQALEKFRKAGADKAVLAALREAWRANVPKPLGDKDIRMMLGEDVPGDAIITAVMERGIDFRPSEDYLDEIRSEGARDALIETLRKAAPRPYSMNELLPLLATRVDQDWLAQKVQVRGIDFEPSKANLQTLQNHGALAPLLAALRATKRAQPFVPMVPPPPPVSRPLVQGGTATLICDASDRDVPVFADPRDLGSVVAHLHCGEHVTFVEPVVSPPGMDKIRYADGKEGYVANSYLELPIATPGGSVTAPSIIYKLDPPYTPEAARDKIEGTIKLWIVVDTQGNVTDVQEGSAPLGDGLDQSAMDTVKKWRFIPATRSGAAVPVRVTVEVSFRLRHKAP